MYQQFISTQIWAQMMYHCMDFFLPSTYIVSPGTSTHQNIAYPHFTYLICIHTEVPIIIDIQSSEILLPLHVCEVNKG